MTYEEAIRRITVHNSIHQRREPRSVYITEALHMAVVALEKQIPKKPIIWEHRTIESPIPNDDWGYECPCCGNCDIDYPEHHCECGQALDWSDTE